MKKILSLTLLVAALGASTSALAQVAGPTGLPPQAPTGAHKGDRVGRKEMLKINEEILAKLNLTDDQKTKIKAHDEEMKAKLLELRKGAKGTKGAGVPEDAKEKIKAIRKENQEFMKATLTKEQLREMMKLRREAVKEYQDKNVAPPVKP